ncbi:MAG: DUF6962 family protein [Chloroflexota bacterium]
MSAIAGEHRSRLGLAEPAVALTDLAVGFEAAVCALAMGRASLGDRATARARRLQAWLVAFFAATATAALAGAVLHGIPRDWRVVIRSRLWRISLGSIGVASLSAWWISAGVLRRPSPIGSVLPAVTAAHAGYLAVVSVSEPPYAVAIATYVPGAVALGGALASRLPDPAWRRPAGLGLLALGVTFAAAGVQVRRIAIHPTLFDHNALYHTLQAAGVGIFLASGRGLIRAAAQPVERQ